MGNINNVWYLKDSGGDWASTKCELDDCYSIPFDRELDKDLYLQVDIPGGGYASGIWLTDLNGHRVIDIMPLTEWKTIRGDDINRLIFRVPDRGPCQEYDTGEGITRCILDIYANNSDAYLQGLLNNYLNGLHNTRVYINIGGIEYNIDLPLPAGYTYLGNLKVEVPCNYNVPPGYNTVQILSNVGNGAMGDTFDTLTIDRTPVRAMLNCFRFEVPVMASQEGGLIATLLTEPFHCPDCQPTLKISSDYCLAATDIFGTFIFNPFAIEGTKAGSLKTAKNDFRIQAVLKQLPSKVSANRNIRCNNFKSTLQQRYKLQGAMPTDFPDYMVNIIESIFSGKKVYIEGEEYIADGDVIFTERSVAGRSMKKLDVELVKCERGLIFECKCVVDCDEGAPSRGFFITPAANLNTSGNMQYGVGREYTYASVSVSGPYPPYTISGWATGGDCLPTDDIVGHEFDDSRSYNIFKRQAVHFVGFPFGCTCAGNPGCGCRPEEYTSIICQVTDSRGCRYQAGLTVEREDLRCSGYGANFTVSSPGPGQIKVSGITGSWSHYSIVLNDTTVITGITTDPYTVTGLTPGQEHEVFIVLYCPDGEGRIGPRYITP